MEPVDCSRLATNHSKTPVTKLGPGPQYTHVRASADRRRWPTSATNSQSSERYGGARPCRALYTRTANLNSTRRWTGSQWSCRKTGVCMCSPAVLSAWSAWLLRSAPTAGVEKGSRWCRWVPSCSNPADWRRMAGWITVAAASIDNARSVGRICRNC